MGDARWDTIRSSISTTLGSLDFIPKARESSGTIWNWRVPWSGLQILRETLAADMNWRRRIAKIIPSKSPSDEPGIFVQKNFEAIKLPMNWNDVFSISLASQWASGSVWPEAPFSSGQLCCCGNRTGGPLGDVHLIPCGQVICLACTDLATLPSPRSVLPELLVPVSPLTCPGTSPGCVW